MAYSTEDPIADSAVALRHWLLPAVALSLALHGGLFYAFSKKTLEQFTPNDTPRLVPRVFNVNRVEVDPKLLETESKPSDKPGKPLADAGALNNLSQFDGSFEDDMKEWRATPVVNPQDVPDLKEKPSVDTKSAQAAAAKAKAESAIALEKDLSAVRQQLLNDKPSVLTAAPRSRLETVRIPVGQTMKTPPIPRRRVAPQFRPDSATWTSYFPARGRSATERLRSLCQPICCLIMILRISDRAPLRVCKSLESLSSGTHKRFSGSKDTPTPLAVRITI